MTKIFPLLWMLAVLPQAFGAETDWRKAAREFMAAQEMAPIEIKPGTRFEADLARERWTWMQRVFLPPFEKHLAQWPAHAAAARSFVTQAFMALHGHPEVDPKRPWEVLSQEGAALIKAGVDDPLVCWLAARAVWEFREGHSDAGRYVYKALHHASIQDYPSMLVVYLNDLTFDRQWPKNPEITANANVQRYTEIMKSAPDASVFGPQDDELLLAELDFIFTTIHDRTAELEKLCDTPHFTHWLREMLHGKLQNQIARSHRGEYTPGTTRMEGTQKFDEHQLQARAHFLKAWELHPDRYAAAAAMIDIVKSGNGRPGDTTRLWFDRALAAQFDCYPAYQNYLETLRPAWRGSLDKMKAFYCACALTGSDGTVMAAAMRLVIDRLAKDSSNIRRILSQSPVKEAAIQTCRNLAESKNVYRVWEHPWRLADLGMMAWATGDYEAADEILQQVPEPFPRQTRRSYHLDLQVSADETNIRAESRLFALGFHREWEAAEELYQSRKVADALQSYQDIAARFQGEPPALLLQRIAACKFEQAFATGSWVTITSAPDLAEWHRFSGSWSGHGGATLVNNGMDGAAYIVHNGRIGANFELMGEYDVKEGSRVQGLSILVGYHTRGETDRWVSCMQWSSFQSVPLGSMRSVYTVPEPRITPPFGGKVWKFHILCRDSAVTYRLNHRDIVTDYRQPFYSNDPFEMPADSTFGFCNASERFALNVHTHIRRLKIRRLDAPAESAQKENNPASLSALRAGFKTECQRTIADLNATTLLEAETLAEDFKRTRNEVASGKIRDFITRLKNGAGVTLEDMPVPVTGEEMLSIMLLGYQGSLNARLAAVRSAWKKKALTLHDATQNPQDAADVMRYVSAELEKDPASSVEEPLAASNQLKWQAQKGEWSRTSDLLAGSGESTVQYACDRKPPFQINFDINVLDGHRSRLIFGNVKFSDEEGTKTFGLYPQPEGAKVFAYEYNKLYHITLKATAEKTELYIDGTKICEGPKMEDEIRLLQFRGGDWDSKGKTEFRNIRISPLP